MKYIYWFAYYNEDSPSVRYRAVYPLQHFKEHHAVDSTIVVPGYRPKKVWAFAKCYLSALLFRKKDSVIVIQRVHSNFIYSSLLKLLVLAKKKRTIYDLDDADYLYCPTDSIYFFARKCSHIMAGSKAISVYLSEFNENIALTSSPIFDMNIMKVQKSTVFTIGWIGGFGGDHKKSLIEQVFPAVRELDFPCKFVLLGVTKAEDVHFIQTYFQNCKHVTLDLPTEIDWLNELGLQQKIVEFDVGIATLMDNEIQRSKSGIKAKQYLNNGVPVLGSNLPENDWVIKDGVNGYYCDNQGDFKKRMDELNAMSHMEFIEFSKNARASTMEFDLERYYVDFMNGVNN